MYYTQVKNNARKSCNCVIVSVFDEEYFIVGGVYCEVLTSSASARSLSLPKQPPRLLCRQHSPPPSPAIAKFPSFGGVPEGRGGQFTNR